METHRATWFGHGLEVGDVMASLYFGNNVHTSVDYCVFDCWEAHAISPCPTLEHHPPNLSDHLPFICLGLHTITCVELMLTRNLIKIGARLLGTRVLMATFPIYLLLLIFSHKLLLIVMMLISKFLISCSLHNILAFKTQELDVHDMN